jgi:hypothetical protein
MKLKKKEPLFKRFNDCGKEQLLYYQINEICFGGWVGGWMAECLPFICTAHYLD